MHDDNASDKQPSDTRNALESWNEAFLDDCVRAPQPAGSLQELAELDRACRDGLLWTAPGRPSASCTWAWIAEAGMSATVAEVVAHAASVWQARAVAGSMTAGSADKYARHAGFLVEHARLLGVSRFDELDSGFAHEWATAAVRVHGRAQHPGIGTVRVRTAVWNSLMGIAVEAGAVASPVTAPRSNRSVATDGESCRPACDDELLAVQEYAATKRGTITPCAVALAVSGAGTGECGEVFVSDSLPEGGIRLPGTYRTGARTVAPGTLWARRVLDERVAELRSVAAAMGWPPGWEAETRLAPSGRATPALRQSAISQTIGEALRRAELRDCDLKPASLPAWAAVKVWDRTGDLGEVAGFLGLSSLTLAARVIGYDWQSCSAAEFRDGPGRLP